MKKYFDLMNDILIKNDGIITRNDIKKFSISSSYFSKFIKENNLLKIKEGEYVTEDFVIDDYYLLQKRYPKAIYSGYSALYLNKLIDRIPDYLEVTMLKGNNIRKDSFNFEIKIHIENNDEIFNIGNCYIKDDFGNDILTFSKEKIIVEMIRKKDSYDSEIYIKTLKNYLSSKDKNLEFLFKYARERKIENKVYDIMELLAYEN